MLQIFQMMTSYFLRLHNKQNKKKKQDQKDLLNLTLCRAINFYVVMQNEKVKLGTKLRDHIEGQS